MQGNCRFCGQATEGQAFDHWVRPTFTDFDKLLPGEIICTDCLFWFDEASIELAQRMGKEKPQRMRTYSHFIRAGDWLPLSKAHKAQMRLLLLQAPFPELAVIADSGQKHLVFRAPRNPPDSAAGWVQFEEQSLWINPTELAHYLAVVDALYATFSKSEIETGDYAGYRIQQLGATEFLALETQVKHWRGQPLFALAVFLAQKEEEFGRDAGDGSGAAGSDLAGDQSDVQGTVSPDDLGAVRERDRERGLHESPGEVRQLPLWET